MPELKSQLIAAGAILPDMDWVPQTGGRTNMVWHLRGDIDLVVKLYSTDTDNPLYTNTPASEHACLKVLDGHDIAPKPKALVQTDAGQVLVYHYVHGVNWTNDVIAVADLLQRVWAVAPPPDLRSASNGTDALIAQSLGIIDRLPAQQADTYRARQPQVATRAPVRPVLIHTDVVAGNLITSAQGLRLIDWQCPALGDPTTDIAMFLSPAMQVTYGTGALPTAKVDAFLDAFDDAGLVARYHALAPVYHWRMAAYCAWRASKGDAGYALAEQAELNALERAQ